MKRILLLVTVASMLAAAMALSGVAQAQGRADVCVSIKGDVKVDKEEGPSTCFSDSTSHAVATNDSSATAIDNSKARATNDSSATALFDSQATATNDSLAVADNNSQATATNNSDAVATNISEATATDNSTALASKSFRQ